MAGMPCIGIEVADQPAVDWLLAAAAGSGEGGVRGGDVHRVVVGVGDRRSVVEGVEEGFEAVADAVDAEFEVEMGAAGAAAFSGVSDVLARCDCVAFGDVAPAVAATGVAEAVRVLDGDFDAARGASRWRAVAAAAGCPPIAGRGADVDDGAGGDYVDGCAGGNHEVPGGVVVVRVVEGVLADYYSLSGQCPVAGDGGRPARDGVLAAGFDLLVVGVKPAGLVLAHGEGVAG